MVASLFLLLNLSEHYCNVTAAECMHADCSFNFSWYISIEWERNGSQQLKLVNTWKKEKMWPRLLWKAHVTWAGAPRACCPSSCCRNPVCFCCFCFLCWNVFLFAVDAELHRPRKKKHFLRHGCCLKRDLCEGSSALSEPKTEEKDFVKSMLQSNFPPQSFRTIINIRTTMTLCVV